MPHAQQAITDLEVARSALRGFVPENLIDLSKSIISYWLQAWDCSSASSTSTSFSSTSVFAASTSASRASSTGSNTSLSSPSSPLQDGSVVSECSPPSKKICHDHAPLTPAEIVTSLPSPATFPLEEKELTSRRNQSQHSPGENMSHFLNKKRFIHEVEEALVCVAELLRFFSTLPLSLTTHSFVVYDICAGKGFLSLLLAYMVPQLPALCAITRIVMIDKNGDQRKIKLGHIEASNKDPSSLPIEFLQANIHDFQFLRALDPVTHGIFLGVHLCSRLSSRFIELFLRLPQINCMILSPCCVPAKSTSLISLNGIELQPQTMWTSQDTVDFPYEQWTNFLFSCIETAGLSAGFSRMFKVPLKGGPHRRNVYLVASKFDDIPIPQTNQTSEQCRKFWSKGKCDFGQNCKYSHDTR